MSATDDISGPWGPLGDIALFGQCKHGQVTLSSLSGPPPTGYKITLPNGTTEPYKGPSLLYADGPDGFEYSHGYGRGGSNFYWQRPGIAPIDRSAEQLAADALLGHQWRNDRANAAWYWCDAAGDRWHVSISLSGGSGLSKTYTLTLKQAGLIGTPGVTRSTTVTVVDPADKALPDDFYGRADDAYRLGIQDINADGSRAAYGVMRRPAAPAANTFELFTMSRAQADMFGIPLYAGSTWVVINAPTIPPYVATSYLELVLSGSVLADAWSASAVTALNRTQTAGSYTYTAAPAHQKVAVWASVWATSYDPWPIEGDPDAQRKTLSPNPTIVTLGTWDHPYGAGVQATIKTIDGAGEYTIAGRDMVVGVMYKTTGGLAVVASDVDYSYTYHSTASGSQAGARVETPKFGAPLVSETRTRANSRSSGATEAASYRVKVDGVLAFEDKIETSYEYSYAAEVAYGPDYMGIPQETITARTSSGLESGTSGPITLALPFDYTAEGVNVIAPLHIGPYPSGAKDPQFYEVNATELATWSNRMGLKSIKGAHPFPGTNDLSWSPGGRRTALWSANLARPTNTCFQYRRGAHYGVYINSWVVVGPVITMDGAMTGQYSGNPVSPHFDPLPPIHVARNPFTGDVVQSVFAVNFV